jgi:hypothetical protein
MTSPVEAYDVLRICRGPSHDANPIPVGVTLSDMAPVGEVLYVT